VVVSAQPGRPGRQSARSPDQGCGIGDRLAARRKVPFITEELGFDHAINYKDGNVPRPAPRAVPEGIDLYFDNVVGRSSTRAWASSPCTAAIVLCGAISTLQRRRPCRGAVELPEPDRPAWPHGGFIILDYVVRFPEAQAAIGAWLLEGRLHHVEHVVPGLEHAPEALNLLFTAATPARSSSRSDQGVVSGAAQAMRSRRAGLT